MSAEFVERFERDVSRHVMEVGALDDGEHWAWVALRNFEHDDFRFQDWERSCKEYTYRFQWCCHALTWAIDKYDKARVEAEVR